MSEVKRFVPRTDSRLEAMKVPAVDDRATNDEVKAIMKPVKDWLKERGVMFNEYDMRNRVTIHRKFQQDLIARPGNWIMIRPLDIVVFSEAEFFENYEEAGEQRTITYKKPEVTEKAVVRLPVWLPGETPALPVLADGDAAIKSNGEVVIKFRNPDHAEHVLKMGPTLLGLHFMYFGAKPEPEKEN